MTYNNINREGTVPGQLSIFDLYPELDPDYNSYLEQLPSASLLSELDKAVRDPKDQSYKEIREVLYHKLTKNSGKKSGRPAKYTDVEKSGMRAMKDAGKSYSEIAKFFSCSKSTVSRLLNMDEDNNNEAR